MGEEGFEGTYDDSGFKIAFLHRRKSGRLPACYKVYYLRLMQPA